MPTKDSFDEMMDEEEEKEESTPNPGPESGAQDSENNTNANADTGPSSSADAKEPTEEQVYQTPHAGPILMPVNEVTEMMTGLERQKLTSGELRQKVVDEHVSSKYWRGQALKYMEWYNNVQHKLREAQAKNQQYVQIPPLPFIPPEYAMNENKDKGNQADDRELLREFGRVVGPYLAVGKYLKEDEGTKTSLVMHDSQGNRYEIPPQLAPYYISPLNQPQQPQSQSAPAQEPQMPSVTIEQGDNKFTIPLSYAPFFMSWISGQNPQTPPNAQESSKETSLNKALANIQNEIKELKSSTSNNSKALPNTDELDRFNSLLNLIDRVEDRRYNKARDRLDEEAGGEVREPYDVQKHRISEEEQTKREKEKTKQKQMETFHNILGSPAGEEEESREREDYIRREEIGKELLNDTIRKAKERNIMI